MALHVKVLIVSLRKPNLSDSKPAPDVFHSYHHVEEEANYGRFRANYLKKQGLNLRLPDKVRQGLMKCEALLYTNTPIAVFWKQSKPLLILLDNLHLISITLEEHTFGLKGVKIIDKAFVPHSIAPIGSAGCFGASWFMITAVRTNSGISKILVSQAKKGYQQELHEVKKSSEVTMAGIEVPELLTSVQINCDRSLAVVYSDNDMRLFAIISDKGNMRISEQPLGEYRISGSAMYCRFSSSKPSVLYTFEHSTNMELKFITWRYDFDHSKFIKSKPAVIGIGSTVSCFEANSDESRFILGCPQGVLILYDVEKAVIRRENAIKNDEIVFIRWHPSESLLCVCGNNAIYFFDCNLKPITLQFEFGQKASKISLLDHLGFKAKVKHLEWHCLSQQALFNREKQNLSFHNLLIIYDRGPIVLLQLELGIFSRGKLTGRELVCQYLSTGQPSKAITFIHTIKNLEEEFLCFEIIVNYLLRGLRSDANRLLDSLYRRCSETFVSRPKLKAGYLSLYRRYFYKLLREGNCEASATVAFKIQTVPLLLDLRSWCYHSGKDNIAEQAQKKLEKFDSSKNDPYSYKRIVGVDQIGSYMSALEDAYNAGEDLSPLDRTRLGLWFENDGRFTEAFDFYYRFEMTEEVRRLTRVAEIVHNYEGELQEMIVALVANPEILALSVNTNKTT